MASFDSGVAAGRRALETVSDSDFEKEWSLLNAGVPFITMTRGGMFRIYVVNHIIHHRAFLCCYLRMNDIRLPGMYGPSGDE